MSVLSQRVYPPLLPVFVSLCLGILTVAYQPAIPKPMLAGIFTIALGIVCLALTRSIGLSVFAAGLWGMGMMGYLLSPERAGPDIASFTDGSPYTLTGQIVSFADPAAIKTRYVLKCDTITQPGQGMIRQVTGKIHLSIYSKPQSKDATHHRDHLNNRTGPADLPYGTRIAVQVKLRPIRNFSNPGGFDYERHLRFQGITASAWIRAGQIKILPEPAENRVWISLVQRLQRIRATCLRCIMSPGVSGAKIMLPVTEREETIQTQARAVLAAMVLGHKSGLDQNLKDRFARAGVSHILSISGLHLSIVGLFSYLLFLQLLRPFQCLVVRGLARKISLALTLVPLSGYAVLAGFSPATQRALIMASVFILAMSLEQETDPINTLSAAGILILSVYPASLFSISFQLSFSAVAGILWGMGWVSRKQWLPKSMLMARVAGAFWVSLFAGIVTAPLTAYYFNMVSLIFLVSNLILVPIMGMACLPLGFAAVGLSFIYPPLAGGVMELTLALIGLCLTIIQWLEGFPMAWARTITPAWYEILVYYAILIGICALLSDRKRTGVKLICLAAAAGICCFAIGVKQRFFPGHLSITALDVGQGACSLIQTPKGKIILIDCGGFAGGSGFNVGRYVVGPYLWRQRIRTLDLVILSHPQSDHMNGLGFILKNFQIGQWMRNRDSADTGYINVLNRLASERKIPVTSPRYPAHIVAVDQVRIQVVPAKPGLFSGLNQNSLVCRLAFGGFSMLFTADIGRPRERELVLRAGQALTSLVMTAPHHGSNSSSSKIFLDHVNPESVIVSCGYRNRYRFPHSDVLDRYNSRNIQVYRTDFHGAVTVRTSGSGYEINRARNH